MQTIPALLTSAATLFLAAAASAQDAAPIAQVPGPVTSSPSSPFGAPVRPLEPLPTPTPPPPVSGSTPGGPALPSIEAQPLPVPSEYRLPPGPRNPAAESGPRQIPPADPGAGAPDGLRLPAPLAQPLDISEKDDAVLALGRLSGSADVFRSAIAAAIMRNPALGEAQASADEAAAVKREARAGLFPTADINVTSYDTVARDFSTQFTDNIVERTRPRARTDAQLSLNQTLYDFGATGNRISAGSARIRAAAATIDDTAAQIALRTIAAWYDIYTYRSLLTIGRAYQLNQQSRRADFALRVSQGANAQVDVARLDSSLASLETRLARYDRAVANAEAQFQQLTGRPAPANLMRAPYLGSLPSTLDDARAAVVDVPGVRAASEQAEATRNDARAQRRDYLPYLSAGVDAGRYGVFEDRRDYDIRARITLRQRIGGAFGARIDQARARADGAVARATRANEEAARDAAIAFTDLQALDRQTDALKHSYLASRQSRDAIEARFRVSRGTLFDILDSNDAYFGAAAAYLESLADRDAAHYVLLARTGRLLGALDIDSAYSQARK